MAPWKRFLAVMAGIAIAVPAWADEVRVLTAGAFKQVVLAAAPDWERETGHRLAVQNDTAGALARRVSAGEPFDLLIVPPAQIAILAATNRLDLRTLRPLARVGLGVAVRAGAPRPAIDSPDAFRAAVLAAPRIAYIDPASGGSSGTYVAGLLERLGIAETMRARSLLVNGGLVAARVADGSADLAIHQISEILPVPGAVLVGPLPEGIQSYTAYSGVVAAGALEAATDFLARLASPAGQAILRTQGMEAPDR